MEGTVTVFGPTSYEWREDVGRIAHHYADHFGITANTYIDHPPGMHLDKVSIDFWGPGGRGDHIDPRTAHRLIRKLKSRTRAPWWRWIIYEEMAWHPDGTTFRPPGGAQWNAGHVHVTFS